ncbi:hypothetical protein ACOSQ3_013861 [Xanthoceras sorbifolium]
MATDEILRLCEALSLSEEDGPVLDIAGDVQADGIRSIEHCLVGKILSRRKVNREAFRGTIEQIWGTVGRIEIEMVGDNVFVFHFQSLEDKAMVWSRGLWHFDKNLIVLEKPVGPGEISQLRFQFSELWIHIYNIPLACMNCKVARLIAEEVGTIVKFPMDSKDLWGKFLRIKVRIDITKPLKRGIRMRLENFETMITALIKYERLPDFCYGCGFIGHAVRECHNSEVRKSIMEGVEPKFGVWLRASPLDRLMLLWNDVWDVLVLSFSRGHIDLVIKMENNLKWRFTGFYGPLFTWNNKRGGGGGGGGLEMFKKD